MSIVFCILAQATSVTLEVSASAVEEGNSVTFTCSTTSNPLPRLRLYRQSKVLAPSVVATVTDVTLSWTTIMMKVDNQAEFYCRVDDNKNIDGWSFDVQSEIHKVNVWCKYKMKNESEMISLLYNINIY